MSDAVDCFIFQEVPFGKLLFVSSPHFLLTFMMHHIIVIKFVAPIGYSIVVFRMIAASEADNLVPS